MRYFFFLFFILFLTSATGQDWIPAKSPNLYINGSVYLSDTSTAYLTGENKVYRSVDRGNSWDKIWESSGAAQTVLTVKVSKTGRIYSGYDQLETDVAKLIYSDDLGVTWESKSVPFVNEIKVIHFHNNEVGLVGGEDRLLRTEDGGETWDIVAQQNGSSFYSIQFMTDLIGILAGGKEPSASMFRTEDGGKTWEKVFAQGQIHYRAQFPTENVGYVASFFNVSKSTDGGKTWSKLNMPNDEIFFQLYFPTADVGYVTTSDYLPGGWHYGSKIFKTTDGGETWAENTVDEDQLYRIHDIDFMGKYGMMVGEELGVYVTELDFLINTDGPEIQREAINIFPNPAKDAIQVDFEGDFSYSIFSSVGILLDEGLCTNGQIDVSSLTPGSYLINVSYQSKHGSSTFIKMK